MLRCSDLISELETMRKMVWQFGKSWAARGVSAELFSTWAFASKKRLLALVRISQTSEEKRRAWSEFGNGRLWDFEARNRSGNGEAMSNLIDFLLFSHFHFICKFLSFFSLCRLSFSSKTVSLLASSYPVFALCFFGL